MIGNWLLRRRFSYADIACVAVVMHLIRTDSAWWLLLAPVLGALVLWLEVKAVR